MDNVIYLIDNLKRKNRQKQIDLNERIEQLKKEIREHNKLKDQMFPQRFELIEKELNGELSDLKRIVETLREEHSAYCKLNQIITFMGQLRDKIHDSSQPHYFIFFTNPDVKNEFSKTIKEILKI